MLRSNYQSNLTRKERFIFLYGEKQGLERYFDVCKKKVSSAFLVSKAEVNALSQIIDILHLNAELIFWNNHQYFCRTLGGIKFLDLLKGNSLEYQICALRYWAIIPIGI